jgi:iron complex outermembrane recepter protein
MFQRTKVATGVLVALGVLATPAFAQTTERVEVTGSRIKSIGATSTSPITSVTAEEINSTQPMAVEEVIRQLPASIPAIGPNTNNGSGGGATIDLRGLGPNRSLVLVNGRRFVPFNLLGVVDTNSIPVALLERVDVFTGGASAVYGADAVAGVVNFVLRRNFQGIEASTSYGVSEEGDAKRMRSDLTMGASFADGRGNVALSLGKTRTDPLIQGERPYSQVSITSTGAALPGGSGTTVPSAFTIIAPTELTAAQWTARGLSGAQQINPATGTLGSTVNLYNFNPPNYFITPLERNQFSALGSFRINDYAEAYADVSYTRSDVQLNLASTGTFNNTYSVPIGNPYMPAAMRQQICTALAGTSRAITNCNVGSTELVSMQINRRITEIGPRINDFQNNTYQYTVGLKGSLPFFSSWGYDGYLSNGKADQVSTRVNWGSLSRSRQALDAISTTACRTTANGCVPLNVFGAEGSITPAQLAFFNVNSIQQQEVIQTVKALTFSGDLGPVASPWAKQPFATAVGFERRITFGGNASDGPSQIQGEVLGTGAPLPDRRGDLKLDELYAEAQLPLVQGKPYVEQLALDVGYRQTKFKTSAATQDYGSWKFGGEYAPVKGLRFRAMQQRATRAPNVNELYAPVVSGLSNLATDPCAGANINAADASRPGTLSNLCVQTGVPIGAVGSLAQPSAGQVNVVAGGNPNLEPEEADTTTIGLVFDPSWAKGLTVSLDYYKITIEKAISNATAAQVNNGCYLTNPTFTPNTLCALVRRSPVDGTLNGGSAPGIVTSQSNLGTIWTEGIDLGVNYRLPLKDLGLPASLGRLDISLNLNHTTQWEIQTIPGVPLLDCLGRYGNSCGGPTYRNKFSQRTVWNLGDWVFQYNWRHVGAADVEDAQVNTPNPANAVAPQFRRIKPYDYIDAAADWNITKNFKLRLSITNLFDKQPPETGSTVGTTATNSGNTFPAWYDVQGRHYTVGATLKF